MGKVSPMLLRAREKQPAFKNLSRTFGDTPSQRPPTPEQLRELRAEVGEVFKLSGSEIEQHHRASTWRYKLIEAVQRKSRDSDTAIVEWITHGAPMGVTKKIAYGQGGFLRQEVPASMSIEDVRAQPIVANHASFEAPPDFEEPPGYEVIQDHLNAGFGLLFRDRKAAEDYLQ